MKKTIKLVLLCLAAFVVTSNVSAETKAFQASLFPSIAIYDNAQKIEGVTLSVWGENPQESLALGFVNGMTEDSVGASLAFFVNYADRYKGAQFGMVNVNNGLRGVQFGFFNFTHNAKAAVQLGFINVIGENTEWFKNFPKELAPVMIFVNWRIVD